MSENTAVIICAAGTGQRFGGKRKKQFVDVAGRAAFVRSIEFFADRDDVKQVLLAINPEDEETVKIKYGPNLSFYGVKLCFGGDERFDTVKAGLEKLRPEIDVVAVHDAVRCCLKKEWIDAVFEQGRKTGAAILAAPVVATLKKTAEGKIVETLDRKDIYEAQTPQVFERKLLEQAYANLENLDKSAISDDAQLIEALGKEVTIVPTDQSNLKITNKSDIQIAEAIIKARPKPSLKGPIGPYNEAQW